MSENSPNVLIVMGMAGSGKTTFVSKLSEDLKSKEQKHFIVNLDPAVLTLPYSPDIDIRTEVSYQGVREQYKLGPNGAILTAFNIFASNFSKVMQSLQERCHDHKYIVIDTPGQIEVFTWSASGTIITDLLASSYPTTTLYIMDTPRNVPHPTTFISNMLYACSIHHKSLLPFVLVFNKIDITKSDRLNEWMGDFEKFLEAVEESSGSYMNNLTRSLSLLLDDYYSILKTSSVSSVTGEGFEQLHSQLQQCRQQYQQNYKPMLQKKKEEGTS